MSYITKDNFEEWIADIYAELGEDCKKSEIDEFLNKISHERDIRLYNMSNDNKYYNKMVIADNGSILVCEYECVDGVYKIAGLYTKYYDIELPDYFSYLLDACVMDKYIKNYNTTGAVYEVRYYINDIESLFIAIEKLETHMIDKITSIVNHKIMIMLNEFKKRDAELLNAVQAKFNT